MLVDDGTIGLADPVDGWLPELAERRVLSHPAAAIDDTVPAERAIAVDDLLTFRLGLGGDPLDDLVGDLALLARTRLVDQPVEALAANRVRHLPTVTGLHDNSRAMTWLVAPVAAASTIRHRNANA